ncbi:MAG: CBS domain-containing protein [Methanosarcinaceae archaeon]|nr:CBS domain-containing protein [Methanosarcinaceae archaeon]
MRTEDIQVKDIMTRGVLTMPVESTAGDIVTAMAKNKLSAVAIVDKSGEAVGIISEMDILARIDRIDWKNTLVDELVALSIESINPSSTLQEAAQIMTKKHIHRLVVMSEKCVGASNRPVGIVSAGDLMKKYLQ